MRVGLTVVAALAAAVTLGARPAAAQKLDDPTIVAIFDAANGWDMETGAIAAKKGTTKEVRDFGEMLVRDHNIVRQQGRDLAKKLGVTPTPPKDFGMAKDHEAAIKVLNAAEGKEFDKAFYAHEAAYHKAVIDALNTSLVPALKNQEVKDLVAKVAPAFEAHRAAAADRLSRLQAAAK